MAVEQVQGQTQGEPLQRPQVAQAERGAGTAGREDSVARLVQRFDEIAADGRIDPGESERFYDALRHLGAAERQDLYRAVAERDPNEVIGRSPDPQEARDNAAADRHRLFYELLTPLQTFRNELQTEYVTYLTDQASSEARVDFVRGLAGAAAENGISASDVGEVLVSLEGERYALRQAYDALIQHDLERPGPNLALANVFRSAAGSLYTAAAEPFIGELIETFRTTLGDERQDVFRKAGAFEAATRVLNEGPTGAETVERSLLELAQMVGADGAALVRELEASYGQSFAGGLQAYFEVALRTGTDDALAAAGATFGLLRAPVEGYIAEVQRIHDARAEIDARAAANPGAPSAADLLTEAQYAFYPDEQAPRGYEWHSERLRAFEAQSSAYAYARAGEMLERAVGALNDSVEDIAGKTNRFLGVANFSIQYLLARHPVASTAVDLSAGAIQEAVKFGADRVQEGNQEKAGDLAGRLDVPRNRGAQTPGQPPPELSPLGQTDVTAAELAAGPDPQDPVPYHAYMLLSDLKDFVLTGADGGASDAHATGAGASVSGDVATRGEADLGRARVTQPLDGPGPDSAPPSESEAFVRAFERAVGADGQLDRDERGDLRRQLAELGEGARQDAYRELIADKAAGAGHDADAIRALFDLVNPVRQQQLVDVVSRAAPQAQLGVIEALAPVTTEDPGAARAVGDILAEMRPVAYRGGSHTSEPPVAEALAALIDSSTDHARLRAVLAAAVALPAVASVSGDHERLDDIVQSVHLGLGSDDLRAKTIVFDQAATMLKDNRHRLTEQGELDAMTALGGMLIEGGHAFMAQRQSGNQTGDGLTDLFEVAIDNTGRDSRLGRASAALLGVTLEAFRAPLDAFVGELARADAAGDSEAIQALARSISPGTINESMSADVEAASPFITRQVEHLEVLREAMIAAGERVTGAAEDRAGTLRNIVQSVITGLTVQLGLGGFRAGGAAQGSGVAAEALRRAADDLGERRVEGAGLVPGDPSDYDSVRAYLEAATRPRAVADDGEARYADRDLTLEDPAARAVLRVLLDRLGL